MPFFVNDQAKERYDDQSYLSDMEDLFTQRFSENLKVKLIKLQNKPIYPAFIKGKVF